MPRRVVRVSVKRREGKERNIWRNIRGSCEKTRQGGAVVGLRAEAPGRITLTERVTAGKWKETKSDGLRGRRRGWREKSENGHDTVVYPGISTRDKDHPRSRYSPTDLERGCNPRLTHEAENTHDNVRHLRNVYHPLREGPVIKKQLIYATKQKNTRGQGAHEKAQTILIAHLDVGD